MKNWALVPLAALGAGHLANAANVNRAIENELFPHLKTCGVSTGSHGKIKEQVTLRLVFSLLSNTIIWPCKKDRTINVEDRLLSVRSSDRVFFYLARISGG